MAEASIKPAAGGRGVAWVLLDERVGSAQTWDVGQVLAETGNCFAAVVMPLGTDPDAAVAAAIRCHRDFGVAIMPCVRQNALADAVQPLLQCVARLLEAGVLRRWEAVSPTVLIDAAPKVQRGFTEVDSFVRSLRATGVSSVAWIERLVMPSQAPAGVDFSVPCPTVSWDSLRPEVEPRPHEALDLIAGSVHHGVDDAKLAASAIVLTGRRSTWGGEPFKLTGIGAPVQQLWLENARRFAQNRFPPGQNLAFLRLMGQRGERLPGWLPGFLRDPSRPSMVCPPAAAALPTLEWRSTVRPRVAVIVHLYYPELWPEFLKVLRAFPIAADVYLSTPLVIAPAVRARIRRDCPDAIVFGVRNLGRDVLPFLHVLRSVGADAYEFVLKLHGKKSVHMTDREGSQVLGGGEAWRHTAVEELAGSTERIEAILGYLEARPEVGMLAPANQLFSQEKWRCGTGTLVEHLCLNLGVKARATHFPAGTMFWLRPRAIAQLLTAAPGLLDFERECGQVDCTLHHAIERFMAHAAVEGGYRLADTSCLGSV